QAGGERAGEAELGAGCDDQPGPPVGGLRVADFRGGPAEGLLEQAEGVLEVKPAQERLPQPVGVTGAGAGARPPQPPGLWVAVPGQVINGQPDQGPLDDGQLAVMVLPGGPAGQPGVQPVP